MSGTSGAADFAPPAAAGAARDRRVLIAWGLALAALSIIVSRLPLLPNGYGSDDDSWRNAVAARRREASLRHA